MGNHCTPLEVCKRLIGKFELIGEICGIHPKSPYQWRDGQGLRAAGDLPFAAHMRRLLDYSDRLGLGLTADHLIRGASEDEIAAILAARNAPPSLEAAE